MGQNTSKPIIVVKIGGRPAASMERLDSLMKDMAELGAQYHFALVHGGGAEVSELTRHFGLEPQFIDGIRMTTQEEMRLVDMVLGGSMNTRLLRRACLAGLEAVGLSGVDGGLFQCQSIGESPDGRINRTGRVVSVNPRVVAHQFAGGFTPILSSISVDDQGEGLNINADDAALALAEALQARSLIFISDIPGVLKADAVIHSLTPRGIEEEIKSGVIQGGMIPKVRASAGALSQGVEAVTIGDYHNQGDLDLLIRGSKGTKITR